jgi:hypothetical protein
MFNAIKILLVFAALAPSAARACIPDMSASNVDAFAFGTTVVNSLGWAKEGLAKENKKAPGLTERLVNMKSAREDYSCAGKILVPFAASKDERIRGSSEVLTRGYDNIRLANELAEAKLIELIDQGSAGKSPGQGTIANLFATMRQNADGAWNDQMLAIAVTAHTFVKFDNGKPTGSLRITRA